MDGHSFDRIARLLGGASSRRAGIKAAVLAAVGLATRGVLPDDPAAAKPGQDGPCDDRSGKMNRCTVDGDCCTKYCKAGKSGKTGRCRCIHRGKPCRPEQKCCHGTCTNGKCPRKKRRCVKPGGSCKTRVKKKKNGKKKRIRRGCCSGKCANGRCPQSCKANGASCAAASECCGGECTSGICGGSCKADGANCSAAGECCGGQCTSGTCGGSCKADGASCSAAGECCGGQCTSGTCGDGEVLIGRPCVLGSSTCKDPNATCTTYADNSNGQGTFCLLANTLTCVDDLDCVEASCTSGVCTAFTGLANGKACTADGDCGSGLCNILTAFDGDTYGRCISPKTVWAKLTWTKPVKNNADCGGDLDCWVWLPATAPTTSSQANCPTKIWDMTQGDVVNWRTEWYPRTIADPETERPSVWQDVDETRPSSERMFWFVPIPGGTYRYAVKAYSICEQDWGETNACGSGWSQINDTYCDSPDTVTVKPMLNSTYGATVEFYNGNTLMRTFTMPSTRTGTDSNPSHYYWWNVADLSFDSNGWFEDFTTPGSTTDGQILNCAPAPYVGNMCSESSNICV